jgi:divalent metal cation (Fe/Co/Zn/Cd) transporter
MTCELAFSLYAGIRAHSVALVAFGTDSGIELLSALVVLRRFNIGATVEKMAARINAALLYLLGIYILVCSAASVLKPQFRAAPTYLGIAILAISGLVMPLLARRKRALATIIESFSLKADAAQGSICAYMSWIALAGVATNTFFKVYWADSAAALLLLPLVLYEAKEAWRGNECSC